MSGRSMKLPCVALPVALLVTIGGCIAPPTVTPSKCGDGIHDQLAGEQCDDGGQSAACNMDCTLAACGDGRANPAAGEECDDGNTTSGDGCSITCRFERCGDGVVDEAVGEECDDGNRVAGDGCGESCWIERCGNGKLDGSEQCDDGRASPACDADCTLAMCGDGIFNAQAEACDAGGVDTRECDRDCTLPGCGDQVVNGEAGETCDEGGIDTPTCNRDCRTPACGDGLVNVVAGEQCDVESDTAQCDVDCTFALCGDGRVNASAGEACDDGGTSAACDADCTPAVCGDGQVNPVRGESCDDGDTISGDGCSAVCRLERCGNGTLDPFETCDDGNHVSGDGCSEDCRSAEICGNGILDAVAGEQCDDGGMSIRCNANCTVARCGDFVVNAAAGETCDDGGENTAACDRDCTQPVCGDFVVNPARSEECDRGGVNMPSCDRDCTMPRCGDFVVNLAVGETCDQGGVNTVTCDGNCTAPACGDRLVNEASGEACDDGGETAACDRDCTLVACGDGHVNAEAGEQCDTSIDTALCDTDCTVAWCGDGYVNAARGEICDDGNNLSGDGCSADCYSDEVCGNGIVDALAGEQCDDGGESEQCDSDCTLALCGDGAVNAQAGEACDEDGVDTATCNINCTVPSCGDGHVNLAAGEDCESGGESLFCDGDCTFAWCGDGTLNVVAGEACDDGNADDNDWCLATCESASCEDGIRNGDEEDVDCGGHCDACAEPQAMIVTGGYHTCALLETGAVRCWGKGGNGQLGYGNTNDIGDDEAPATAGDVNVGGPVVQLAAGNSHTCALLETGAVRCWGYGELGQLGYGNTNDIGDDEAPTTAGDVNVGGRVVQLAAGEWHTCALLETGAVRCWGRGWLGQLGYGNTNDIGDDEAPTTAGDVNVGGPVVHLAAGGSHTCAVLETSAVRCWGFGGAGRLGYGNTNRIGDDEEPATAGDVNVGGPVVQLAAGSSHTCALLETGTVRCWGYGEYGRLGYGNRTTIGEDEEPATAGDVNVNGRVVQLVAGGYHTCALLETGAVRCWGQGWYGQLGYGNTNAIGDNEAPATAGDVDVGGLMVKLAAGGDHTCALLETGAVRCWGGNWAGQLGYGNTNIIGDDEVPAMAGDVYVGGGHASEVRLASGDEHTCVLLETGAVRCWGDGADGRLGHGNTNTLGDDEAPATAGDVDVNVSDREVQLATGHEHTCALLETGAVRCWGYGGSGQLGYGNTNTIGDDEALAAAGDVNVGGAVVQLVAGYAHTCALLETGAVRCWGYGGSGQLGYGNTNGIGDDEVPATAGDVNVGGPVVQLAAGRAHTCALLETGAVRCWGYGGSGRLGYGNWTSIGDDEAPATAGDVDVGGPVVQLAAGGYHTCALLETGAVRCWGSGGSGRLGYRNTNDIGDNETPATAGDVNVGGLVIQLAAGDEHTCALLETGAVRCWGDGQYGRLGYGNTNSIGDNEAPATAGDVNVGGPVAQLAAGGVHTCALLETGAVRCWGYSGNGQLGYGNTNPIGDTEVPATAGDVNVGGSVAQLAAGAWHTCVLLETGAVRCWGYGGSGQLGYGNTNTIGDNEVPATAGDVNVNGRVIQLVAGAAHTCALLETGAVRCWGYGEHGRLGYGNTNDIGDDEVPATAGDVNVGGRVLQLAAGEAHTCALLETGAVRCWGYGGYGQLGYGNTNNIGDDEVPATAGDVNIGGLVIQLAVGAHHTCALLQTGKVRCWGEGGSGQLGYGNTNNMGDDEAPATAGDVNVGGHVGQLAAGGAHTCALLATGAVRCWGDGEEGQLGYGNTSFIGDNEVAATAGDVNVGGPVARLGAGGYHTCALLETGTVRCWGRGWLGQLGYGNTSNIGDTEAPATAGDVGVGGPVVLLAAGGAHTCVLMDTNDVRCWGYGRFGQLGYGNTLTIGDNETPASAGNVPYR